MYLCISLFGRLNEASNIFAEPVIMFAVAGLIFSLINSVVKPLVKLFTLPFALITMGLSTVIINVAMTALAIWLLPGVEMGFWGVVASSAILSSINVILTVFI